MGTTIFDVKNRTGSPERIAGGEYVERIYLPVIVTQMRPQFSLRKNLMEGYGSVSIIEITIAKQ